MAGSPIFDAVRRVLKLAAEAARPGAPPVDDLLEMQERFLSERAERLTRRRFLEAAAFSSVALAGGETLIPRVTWTHPPSGSALLESTTGLEQRKWLRSWPSRRSKFRSGTYWVGQGVCATAQPG